MVRHCTVVFQLVTNSLLSGKITLEYFLSGSLPPAYQRSLLVLSAAMLAFTAKIYQITDLNVLLESLRGCGVSNL